jgi:hypothetical protein
MGLNPQCNECDEVMELEPAADVAWNFIENSPEIRTLFALSSMGIDVWYCWGCGEFFPAGMTARRVE